VFDAALVHFSSSAVTELTTRFSFIPVEFGLSPDSPDKLTSLLSILR
jgi:hypothetical protein